VPEVQEESILATGDRPITIQFNAFERLLRERGIIIPKSTTEAKHDSKQNKGYEDAPTVLSAR